MCGILRSHVPRVLYNYLCGLIRDIHYIIHVSRYLPCFGCTYHTINQLYTRHEILWLASDTGCIQQLVGAAPLRTTGAYCVTPYVLLAVVLFSPIEMDVFFAASLFCDHKAERERHRRITFSWKRGIIHNVITSSLTSYISNG